MLIATTLQQRGTQLELLTAPMPSVYYPTGMGAMLVAWCRRCFG
ncbi:hypothetical protein ACSDR0_48250 [Streptosporangium sp. G11]